MTQDTGCAPFQLLPKRESRGGSGDAHTVGRKPKCYQWDNLGRGVKGGEDMSPPQDLQLLLRLENAASPLTPAAQKLWKTTGPI